MPRVRRLHVIIPNIWLEEDREAWSNPEREEALEHLVERRTGVRPIRDTTRIWAIVHRMPEEARNWDEATKAAFLEEHETRPLSPWQRREQQ